MSSTTESRTAISLTPPATSRLRLQQDRSAYALLDGGTPALVAAITRSASLAAGPRHP